MLFLLIVIYFYMGCLWMRNVTWLLAMRDGDQYSITHSDFIVGLCFWPFIFVFGMYIYFKHGNFITVYGENESDIEIQS